jgi:RND family efflux transporter MFP subunit
MNSRGKMQLSSNFQDGLGKQKSRIGHLWNNSRRAVLPLLVVVFSGLLIAFFMFNKPAVQQRRPSTAPAITVAVHEVEASEYQVNVQSYGTVAPRTQSFLVAQVSGQVIELSDKLRDGRFFDAGDVLLKIDDRDYQADVKIAEANLADAQRSLTEENARSAQAERDWARLGNDGEPSELVLRKPQLLAAEARVASSDAALDRAELSLERTEVIAPFAGRVLRQMVDLGQVAGNNTQVAEVYATDYIEVRLPLRNADLQFVDLPESYRGVQRETGGFQVTLYSSISGAEQGWLGEVVRTESAIDQNSRQLHVVAQIDDPFGEAAVGRSPLKIGEYVTAELQGKIISGAIVIPADAIYQSSYVYVVNDGVLIRREIDIAWQSTSEALISSGLVAGDRLVTTTLGQVTSGLRVAIEGEVSESSFAGRGPGQGPGQAREPGQGGNFAGQASGGRSEGGVPDTEKMKAKGFAPNANVGERRGPPTSGSETSNAEQQGDRS